MWSKIAKSGAYHMRVVQLLLCLTHSLIFKSRLERQYKYSAKVLSPCSTRFTIDLALRRQDRSNRGRASVDCHQTGSHYLGEDSHTPITYHIATTKYSCMTRELNCFDFCHALLGVISLFKGSGLILAKLEV